MKIKKIRIIENHYILYHYDCTRVAFFAKYGILEEESPESKGTTYTVAGYNPCVWVRDQSNFPTIAHEILHAIHHISRTVGIEYNQGSEEWFTYSLSYALREILAIKK